MKNLMKAVKKFRFWSRKRKRRKTHEPYYPPPPPTRPPPPPPPYHYCCSFSYTQPSAPALPSWLEAEQNYGTFSEPIDHPMPENEFPIQSQAPQQENVIDPRPTFASLPLSSSISYQQYMVPEPVYGVPVTQTATRERSSGAFGCVFSFGAHLFRCLFPCFHIREAA